MKGFWYPLRVRTLNMPDGVWDCRWIAAMSAADAIQHAMGSPWVVFADIDPYIMTGNAPTERPWIAPWANRTQYHQQRMEAHHDERISTGICTCGRAWPCVYGFTE